MQIRQCRGRPKGSRDKGPRARRGDSDALLHRRESAPAAPALYPALQPWRAGGDTPVASTPPSESESSQRASSAPPTEQTPWAAAEQAMHLFPDSCCAALPDTCCASAATAAAGFGAWAASPVDDLEDPFHADSEYW